jgi:hypothetical protein
MYKVNSLKHRLLEKLVYGNTRLENLAFVIGQIRSATKRFLSQMITDGTVEYVPSNTEYKVTNKGIDVYTQMGIVSIKPTIKLSKKAEVKKLSDLGTLDPNYLNLNKMVFRDGSMDYLKYPSLYMGQERKRS